MKGRQLARKLKAIGVEIKSSRGKGGHVLASFNGRQTVIKTHGTKDLTNNYIRLVCKQLGIDPLLSQLHFKNWTRSLVHTVLSNPLMLSRHEIRKRLRQASASQLSPLTHVHVGNSGQRFLLIRNPGISIAYWIPRSGVPDQVRYDEEN